MICTKRIKEKNFQENGGKVLKNQRVRIFSEAALVKATNNYADDRKLGEGGFGSVYKGVLTENTVVAVKKSKGVDKAQMNAEFQKEMSIVSQVNHRNVVKLLGLCLETKVPLLVYEFISNGTLSKHIHDKGSRILASWTNRLRVASEAALALDYLHSLADPPVIHGDVKSVNILLDNNYTAKVADFGASVLMSPGQTDILATKIQGTLGYLDPEYLMTGILTVQSDVYSFGVVLVELLTGEMPNSISKYGEKRNVIQHFISALENNHLFKILDFQTANEGEMDEIEAVAELAKGCLNSMGVNRPTMKEVSDELAKLKALHQKSLAQKNSEETDYLLGESSQSFCKNASPPMDQSQTKLGEGGFGSVYRGVLADDDVQVAVKKFKGVDKAQMNEEFQKEMGVVSQVNHKNVVKLLGLCLETKVPLLVYEFISNGTLFKHVHDKTSQLLASWSNRLRIASEIALALNYLHSLADPPIIHGDVKSVNILLDNNYTAKAADEGEMDEIEAVAELAKGCLNSMGLNRPTMKEVSDELAKLKYLHQKSWAQQNSDETEYLLGESSQSFGKIAPRPMTQSQTVIPLEIENFSDSN
ncbi:hypothetical protein POTOM_060425 [Populus tomentosa]|uniref:Protein kinase domain-containing protein n=1 Tax=Populus tomentosa TaxID=118781 RepID=A0A8X8C1Y6_POPTO|nr:hypothetical protein POTOM_060425 [Populus tomentosa]